MAAEGSADLTKPAAAMGKTVEELVKDGNEISQGYIWKDTVDLSVPLITDVPIIDFGQLVLSSSAELLKLHSALCSWGCFQLVNHGIEEWLLDELRQAAREFFHLPMAEKQKYAKEDDGYEGYGNDKILFDNQPLDWTDRLYLLMLPEDEQKLKYWPQTPESFRKLLLEYTAKARQITDQLLKSMSKTLRLAEDCFLNKFGHEKLTMVARFNYYPPCPKPDQVLGLKPHTDGSAFTILLQDKHVKGLQLLRDDQWFWVPLMPYALVINIGDQLEIMSNGLFKSPIHRAVTNSEKERNTCAIFCTPDPAKEFGPLEELVNDKRPKMFKEVKNYQEIYFHYYQQAKRAIDAVRI